MARDTIDLREAPLGPTAVVVSTSFAPQSLMRLLNAWMADRGFAGRGLKVLAAWVLQGTGRGARMGGRRGGQGETRVKVHGEVQVIGYGGSGMRRRARVGGTCEGGEEVREGSVSSSP